MKRRLFAVFLCVLLVTNLFATPTGAAGDDETPELVHVDAVEPTCEEDGNMEYWYQDIAGKKLYFADDKGSKEISEENIIRYAIGHDWGSPSWKWEDADGEVTAKVTFICSHDASHTQTVYAEIGESEEDDVEPTCVENGKKVYHGYAMAEGTEAYFEETHTVTLPATGHKWGEPKWAWNETDGTATAQFVCGNDESHQVQKTVPYSVHNTASCEAAGEKYYTASVTLEGTSYEGQTEPVTVEPLGHKWSQPEWVWREDGTASAQFTCGNDTAHTQIVKADVKETEHVNAACQAEGKIVYHASVDFAWEGEAIQTFTDDHQVKLPALGHDWDKGKVTKAPTCTEAGVKTYTCQHDHSHTKTEKVAPLGHDWDKGKITKAPICTEAGVKTYTCQHDHSHTKTEKVAPLGHDWDKGKVTKAPTCTEAGVKTYTCQRDGSHTKTEKVAQLGHDWDKGKVTKAPTCTEAGVKTYTCQRDDSHTKTEKVAQLGHDWDKGKVTKAPTCTEAGVKTYTCQRDGSHTKTEKVAPLGHNWDKGRVTKAPTCTETGVRTFTCTNDRNHTKTEVIPALGHKYTTVWSSDGNAHWHNCTVCGEISDRAAHRSAAPASETAPELCAVCGYVMAPKLPFSAQVSFRETGDTSIPDLNFVQQDSKSFAVKLPQTAPSRNSYYFEGWLSSEDTQLHQPGEDFTFDFEAYRSVTFTGTWTQVIGVGSYDLNGGTKYRLAAGRYQIDGDDTVYEGDQPFYLGTDGHYTVREGR